MATFEMGALLRKRYNEFLGPYYEEGKGLFHYLILDVLTNIIELFVR